MNRSSTHRAPVLAPVLAPFFTMIAALVLAVSALSCGSPPPAGQVALPDPPARAAGAPEGREMAVTFDDLPVNTRGRDDIELMESITTRLVESLTRNGVPVVGFVNERNLSPNGVLDDRRVGLLRTWIDAGLELGNHTWSHPSLHKISVEEYRENIVRGEPVTRELMETAGRALRWFRHPYLHTGATLEAKRSVEGFLAGRGYRIAPVTIDNSEWMFAFAYDHARTRGDEDVAARIRAAYVPYIDRCIAYYEAQSKALFGREIRQVLLLHANALNAEMFDDIAESIRKRGYRFVPLERALEDEAFGSPDTWTGAGGISWLHRWALTEGRDRNFFQGEPEVPEFVREQQP